AHRDLHQLRSLGRARCAGRGRAIGVRALGVERLVPGGRFEPAICRSDADTEGAAQAYAGAAELISYVDRRQGIEIDPSAIPRHDRITLHPERGPLMLYEF